MKRADYQPGTPLPARARSDGERATLVLVRELRHSPDAVWSALTDPAQLHAWAPFDAARDLGSLGDTQLMMAPTTEAMPCTVRHADRPRLLEYTWGENVLRWELEPIATGTRLTLHHTVTDRSWLAKVGAGWQICLDVMDFALGGEPIGRIVAEEAMNFGWQRLADAYAATLG